MSRPGICVAVYANKMLLKLQHCDNVGLTLFSNETSNYFR